MTETPRSPDNPDDVDARPDVGDSNAPTPESPATTPMDPSAPGNAPDDDADDGADDPRDDMPADPVADASDDEAAAAGAVVIPEYEQRLTEASAAGDPARIAEIQAEYNQARLDQVREADSD
jgi:hypothetical protein